MPTQPVARYTLRMEGGGVSVVIDHCASGLGSYKLYYTIKCGMWMDSRPIHAMESYEFEEALVL